MGDDGQTLNESGSPSHFGRALRRKKKPLRFTFFMRAGFKHDKAPDVKITNQIKSNPSQRERESVKAKAKYANANAKCNAKCIVAAD